MREVRVGNRDVRVIGSPMTLFFYKKEFNADLIGDVLSFTKFHDDIGEMKGLEVLQIIWALEKTANAGKVFPGFETWLSEFEYLDFGSEDMLSAVMEVAEKAFFRKHEEVGEKP